MRLIMHIGTAKTATTTIQRFVYANRAALLEHGVGLSDALGVTNNHMLSTFCLPVEKNGKWYKQKNLNSTEQKENFFGKMESEFLAEIEVLKKTCKTMFITSEQLYGLHGTPGCLEKLHGFLAPHFDEIRILVYFREQSSFLKSLYSTKIKSGADVEFSAFVGERKTGHVLDYNAAMTNWAAVFGQKNIDARLFLADRFPDRDIRKDVVNAFDCGVSPEKLDYSVETENQSLGEIGIRLGRINNKVNLRLRPDGTSNKMNQRLIRLIDNSELGHVAKMAFPEAQELYNEYDEANTLLSKNFMGVNKNPFPRPPLDKVANPVTALGTEAAYESMLKLFEEIFKLTSETTTLTKDELRGMRNLAGRIASGTCEPKEDSEALLRMIESMALPPSEEKLAKRRKGDDGGVKRRKRQAII